GGLTWALGDGNVAEAQAVELLQDVDGAISSSRPLTDAVLAQVPSLKVIAVRGVGYDSVDVEAATRRGLPVLVAPGFTESVADYTFGLMLAVARPVAPACPLVGGGRGEEVVRTTLCLES